MSIGINGTSAEARATDWVSYQLYDSGLILNGTSGAAILNARREVVGINLRGGESESELYGYGNPLFL